MCLTSTSLLLLHPSTPLLETWVPLDKSVRTDLSGAYAELIGQPLLVGYACR